MRVALATSLIVGAALILFVIVIAAKKAQKRRRMVKNLTNEVVALRATIQLITSEVEVQETAHYSDVTPIRNILNNSKELLP